MKGEIRRRARMVLRGPARSMVAEEAAAPRTRNKRGLLEAKDDDQEEDDESNKHLF